MPAASCQQRKPIHERTCRRNLQRQGRSAVRHHDGRLGHRRHGGRRADRRPALLAGAEFRHPLADLQPPAAAAHQCGDLRLRRLRPDRHFLLRRAAHLPRAPVRRSPGGLYVLGLAAGHRGGRHHAAARHHPGQGIRRARMADRSADHGRLGGLRHRVLRHHRPAARAAHLRRQLVLCRLHYHDRGAARLQQSGNTGDADQVLRHLRRRRRRDDGVVVRPQRGRLLPDRRLPRHDVLLRAQAGPAADLLLPPVGGAFLGADLGLHVGRPAPPALHRAARLGADRSAWCSRCCCWRRPGAA